MRYFTRLPLTIAVFAALGLGGTTALAQPGPSPLDQIVVVDDPCEPAEEDCGDPDPEINPDIPQIPPVLTDDPCEPAEEDCGDPEDIPEEERIPEEEETPEDTPDPEPCELDDVCTRTPTFTG